jgi:hypothetical protein
MLPAYWQHARRKRRGSGRAASYKLANQASSAGVWRRESTKRRARTSLPLCHACFLRSLSLARPAALPAWVMQPVATASLFLGVMYRVHRAHLSALGPRAPGAQALVARPKKPQPPTEGVFSTTPSTTPSTTTPTQAKKGAITEFRTSWGGLIFRLLATRSDRGMPRAAKARKTSAEKQTKYIGLVFPKKNTQNWSRSVLRLLCT